jgi:hypothetical protein
VYSGKLKTVVFPAVDEIVGKLGDDASAFIDPLESGSTAGLRKLLLSFFDAILNAIEIIGDIDFFVVGKILEHVLDCFNSELDLPVLAAMYDVLTTLMGEEESFNIINGMSFIAALAVVTTLEVTDGRQLTDYNSMDYRFHNLP